MSPLQLIGSVEKTPTYFKQNNTSIFVVLEACYFIDWIDRLYVLMPISIELGGNEVISFILVYYPIHEPIEVSLYPTIPYSFNILYARIGIKYQPNVHRRRER